MSKKFGIMSYRSANSVFGSKASWAKNNGIRLEFNSAKEAEVEKMNKGLTTQNVHYSVYPII